MLSFFNKKWKQIQATKITLFFTKKRAQIHLLCVDDDPDFCHYLRRIAKKQNIEIHVASSIKEGKEKIENEAKYTAYLIDGHLPDGSGFELVKWMREEKAIWKPIVFLSRIYQDAGSFRNLKENLKVEYVIDKPINPDELRILLKYLCDSPEKVEGEGEEKLYEDLMTRYNSLIPEKIERLEEQILNIQKKPSIDHLTVFKNEIHKIAGSAGSYGYLRVTQLCREMEKSAVEQIELAEKDLVSSEWLDSLDEFFTQMKLNFQIKN
ncbi:MAG: response regulator [Parachlamydia sp.]|jgi:DNA-binding response OmpR family regulator|nr:response regulator [Parachlamydia sp.]